MNTENASLMDVMAVNRDAARKAKKATADKARRAARKAAARASDQTTAIVESPARAANASKIPKMVVPAESAKTVRNRAAAITKASAVRKALDAAITAKAVPGKVTVKKAVLEAFYADPKEVLSTRDAVNAIQAAHPGMNESSIRVWISDFRKDGSVKLVKKQGREAFLKAGKLGKFALR